MYSIARVRMKKITKAELGKEAAAFANFAVKSRSYKYEKMLNQASKSLLRNRPSREGLPVDDSEPLNPLSDYRSLNLQIKQRYINQRMSPTREQQQIMRFRNFNHRRNQSQLQVLKKNGLEDISATQQ